MPTLNCDEETYMAHWHICVDCGHVHEYANKRYIDRHARAR